MNLDKVLLEYGLKEKQAKVYLACLQIGSGPVLKIAQKAGLARSTTELILKSLHERGLASSFKKKSISHYSAEDPRRIIDSLKNKTELIERSLPQFMALYGSGRIKPSVRFYEGRGGMKIILDEILAEAKEMLAFGSADDLFATLKEFNEFVKKRVEAKIPIKVILRDTEKARERQRLGPSQLREVRLIPAAYEFHGLIYIWENKIAMFSLKDELNAVLIEGRELVQVQRSQFQALWSSLSSR